MWRTATQRSPLKEEGIVTSAAKVRNLPATARPQGLATDQFFYFFLRLRKSEIRRIVQRVKSLYPDETPEQWARHIIHAQCSLSFLGGALLHLPQLIPGAGNILKFAGIVGGASMLTRMHMYLILEIALLHDLDIEDQARVPEMLSVIATSGIMAATPLAVAALEWHPTTAIPASGLTSTLVTKAIGEAAIRFYSRRQVAPALAAA
jgi:hypothetical protein